MLHNLHVKNLALIDEIDVEFQEGLNILTGETGAGKSIILGSVNLALGGRYTKDMIREGAQFGIVELTFLVENKKQIERLNELDIYPEESAVTLSRRLMDGRSQSRINGESVSIGLLKEVASILIDIHGQHEHQSLLYKKNHLEIVDSFSGGFLSAVKAETRQAYVSYKACVKELKEADKDDAQRAKELSFLRFEVDEIEKAALIIGEDEELESRYHRMINSRKITEGVTNAYLLTAGEENGASNLLSRAIRTLMDASSCDERAAELYEQLIDVDSLLNDFNRDLAEYSESCAYSEEEFYETENRLNEINHLKQKYGNTISDILSYSEEQIQKIQVLEDYENHIISLKESLNKTEQKYKERSAQLSEIRKEQAVILEKEIQKGLKELNFEEVKFVIHFEESSDYAENGIDDVEFLISLNAGHAVKPLVNVASGGELSRIMLAIKTVMADRDDIETLIFDEIDVGISGRTAQKVSEKMEVIGKKHQVICITHLAQIASMADAHYVIEKIVKDGNTKTDISLLDEKKAVQELARILGGVKITEAVMQNALEMKELAKHMKKSE